ncbi:hypothetical protein AAC387_Pa07g3036 [Persea americana]
MAASLPSFFGLVRPCLPKKVRKSLPVRAQSSEDKGKLNIVDENMSTLTKRIEELRIHERLQRYRRGRVGWNYPHYYDTKLKRDGRVSESLEIAGLVVGTIGFTFLTGTLCLCLVSLVIHLAR